MPAGAAPVSACGRGAAAAAAAARDPEGYRGYVVLQYALAACPVLPRRDGFTVIRFGDDGRACTSETTIVTTLRDRAYYLEPNGDLLDEPINFAVDFELRQEATHRLIGTVFARRRIHSSFRRSTSAAGRTPRAGRACVRADRPCRTLI